MAFSEGMRKCVDDLVDKATIDAVNEYGSYYNSEHESYAVLKEEVEEAKEIMDSFRNMMHIYWKSVRGMEITEVNDFTLKNHAGFIQRRAKHLIAEAAQIAAVCNKIIATEELSAPGGKDGVQL